MRQLGSELVLTIALVAALSPTTARAQVDGGYGGDAGVPAVAVRWVGAVSGDWSEPSNWSGGSVPAADDEVVIDATGAPYTVTVGGTVNVARLWISSADATLTLSASYPIHCNLISAGDIYNGGTIALTSSHANYNATLSVSSGALTNAGTLQFEVGSGGGRSIAAELVNYGTVSVQHSGNLAKAGGTHVSHGMIDIASGKTLSINGNGQTFVHKGGQLNVSGAMSITSATFEHQGGEQQGWVTLSNSSLILSGPGAARFSLRDSCSLSGDVAPEQTLRVYAYYRHHATLTAGQGFVNAGTIALTSSHSSYNTTLAVSSGALINTGTVQVQAGSGGGRTLAADLLNYGTLSVQHDISLSKPGGTYASYGQVDIAAGQRLGMIGNSQKFVHRDGQLKVDGVMNVVQAAFEHQGGEQHGWVTLDSASLILSGPGPASFSLRGASSLSGEVTPDQSVQVSAYYPVHATLTLASDVVNRGTITLTSSHGNYNARLNMPTGRLENFGVLRFEQGSGGGRYLGADLVNYGTVSIDASTTFDRSGGTYTNYAQMDVAGSRWLRITGSGQSFVQAGGQLAISGGVSVANITFEHRGGEVLGRPYLSNAHLILDASGQAAFSLRDSSSVEGEVGSLHDLRVQAYYQHHATVTLAPDLVNSGTITLTSSHSSYNARLSMTTGRLENYGLLRFDESSGGGRNLSANLVNYGTVTVGANTRFDKSGGTHTNYNQLDIVASRWLYINGNSQTFVQAGGQLAISGGMSVANITFEHRGGEVLGRPYLSNAHLILDAPGRAAFTLRDSSSVEGEVGALHDLLVQAYYQHHATLDLAPDLESYGLIALSSSHGSYNATLSAPSGALVNHGSLRLDLGSGGGRSLALELDNRGLFSCSTAASLGRDSAAHSNSGVVEVAADVLTLSGDSFENSADGLLQGRGTLDVSAVSFEQQGRIGPGSSAGTLTITDGLTQGASSRLEVELAGLTPDSEHDVLAVDGEAWLDGTLAVEVADGYSPSVGDSWTVATCAGGCNGSFASHEGTDLGALGGLYFYVLPNEVELRLQATPSFELSPSTTTPSANAAFDLTVTVRDSAGALWSDYSGTVTFASSDPGASLPAPYTFAAGEGGVHVFSGELALVAAGQQSLRVYDSQDSRMNGEVLLDVQPLGVDPAQTDIAAAPTSVEANGSDTSLITVTPRDIFGNAVGSGLGVSIAASGGSLLNGVIDQGDGSYTQLLQAGTSPLTATLSCSVDSVAQDASASVELLADVTAPEPVELSLGLVSSDSVELSWGASASADCSGYEVMWTENGLPQPPDQVSGTSLQVSGLQPCTDYIFEVSPYDLAGNVGLASEPRAARTHLAGAPAAPPSLGGRLLGATVALSWEASPSCDVSSYTLLRKHVSGGPGDLFVPIAEGLGTTSFDDDSVVVGESYVYKVLALDSEGYYSGDSPELAIDTTPPPQPVQSLTATPLAGGLVQLGWALPPTGTPQAYQVFRSTTPGIDVVVSSPVATVSGLEHQDQPPGDGSSFYTVVWLDSLGGQSQPAPEVSASSDATPPTAAISTTPPSPVSTGLVRVLITADEDLLEAPDLSVTPFGGSPIAVSTSGLGRYWLGTLLVDEDFGDGDALFSVGMRDILGNAGSGISSGQILTVDTTPPPAPASLLASAGLQGAIDLSWPEPLDATALTYSVYRSTNPIVSLAGLSPVVTGLPQATYSDLPPSEGVWHYAVVATDAVGNSSGPSPSASAFSDQTPPGVPTGLVARVVGVQVLLSWNAPSGEVPAGYALYRAEASFGGDVSGHAPLQTGITELSAEDLPPHDATFHYVVVALDAVSNPSPPSNEVAVDFDKDPPLIEVSGVEDGAHYDGPVTPLISVSDYSLDTWSATLDGAPFSSGTEVSDEGSHTLLVQAVDLHGHQAVLSLSFTIDTTAPDLSVEGVEEGALYTSPPSATAQASDDHLDTVLMSLDGQPYQAGTPITANGVHQVRAVARDLAGNETVVVVGFEVDVCLGASDDSPCDDGIACTIYDECQAGICVGGTLDSCDDGNPCTDDSCDPSSGCVHAANTAPCSDDNVCTVGDVCGGGVCTSTPASRSTRCDDGDLCTSGGRCDGFGRCTAQPLVCGDGDPCTLDSCDPQRGCVYTADTAVCDDGDPCTVDICLSGVGGCSHLPLPACVEDAGPGEDGGEDAGADLDAGTDLEAGVDAADPVDAALFDAGGDDDAAVLADGAAHADAARPDVVLLADAAGLPDASMTPDVAVPDSAGVDAGIAPVDQDAGAEGLGDGETPAGGCGCALIGGGPLGSVLAVMLAVAALWRRRSCASDHV